MRSIHPSRRGILGGAGGLGLAGLLSGCATSRGVQDRLVVCVNQMPSALDSAAAGLGATSLIPLVENIVEGLLERQSDGSLTPALASYTLSSDLKTAHFTLREGVRFHNGMPLTAQDVVFSNARMRRLAPIYRGQTRSLQQVKAIDDHHVDFTFKDSALTFVRNPPLRIWSKTYYDQVGEQGFRTHPIGTGPYRLADFRQFQYADLDAFEGYWGDPPPVKRVRMVFVPEDMTRIAMLRSGQADLVMAVPFSLVPALKAAGFSAAKAPMHPTFSVRFQLANRSTPWADVRVRRAIAHAIDADAIIKGLFGGIPDHNAGFAPGEPGYDPTLQPYPYDPDRARMLLAEAGYANGFDMPLVYWANTYYGMRETAEAVTLYLRQVGIKCDVAGIDSTQGLEMNRKAATDPNVRLVTIAPALLANTADGAEAIRQGYSSGSAFSWYRNKRFDALVKKAMTSADPAVESEALRQCARILHQDLPIIPLWNNVTVYMMRKGLSFRPTARFLPSMPLKALSKV